MHRRIMYSLAFFSFKMLLPGTGVRTCVRREEALASMDFIVLFLRFSQLCYNPLCSPCLSVNQGPGFLLPNGLFCSSSICNGLPGLLSPEPTVPLPGFITKNCSISVCLKYEPSMSRVIQAEPD